MTLRSVSSSTIGLMKLPYIGHCYNGIEYLWILLHICGRAYKSFCLFLISPLKKKRKNPVQVSQEAKRPRGQEKKKRLYMRIKSLGRLLKSLKSRDPALRAVNLSISIVLRLEDLLDIQMGIEKSHSHRLFRKGFFVN